MNMKEEMTMNQRILSAGICTIRPVYPEEKPLPTELEFNGKKIPRPHVQNCVKVIKEEFGIDI